MRMKNQLRGAAGLALAAMLIAGCGSAPPPQVMAHGVAVREPQADPRPYGAADTALGLDVLDAMCRLDPRANLVMSPSSLASGLGMTYLGARGGTARAMAGVLHLPAMARGQSLAAGLQSRSAGLRGLGGKGVTLSASDQVWADPAVRTERAYLNAVATGYDAGLAQVPLLHDPEKARQQINQAIDTATRGHIPDLLQPGSLQNIGWVLTDALYLNAAWATPFDPNDTVPDSFTTASGRRVTAHFMVDGSYRATVADGWTAVWLPYRGGKLAMEALLPPAGKAGCALPSAAVLTSMTSRLAAGGAGLLDRSVAFPKVSLATHASLKPVLSRLGMGVAFSPAADFTGLSDKACCIGLVEHAATLDIGEKGTVASAATAVGVVASAGRLLPPEVRFDRPYLLMVTASATGEPLFLARVTNPATS